MDISENISPVMRFISWQHYGGLFSDIVSVQLDHFNANFTHSVPDNFQISRIQLLDKSLWQRVFVFVLYLFFCIFFCLEFFASWQRQGMGLIPLTGGCPFLFVRRIISWRPGTTPLYPEVSALIFIMSLFRFCLFSEPFPDTPPPYSLVLGQNVKS